jgi:hypothetical protein
MSDAGKSEDRFGDISHEEMMSTLFAQLVMQQSNMAMLLLGKVPHPQSGETVKDVEGARLFIDQLEMLEVKTKGNLSKQEEALLKQSLMSLRMAFVDAIESPATPAKPAEPGALPEEKKTEPAPAPDSDDESKKKFSKKY